MRTMRGCYAVPGMNVWVGFPCLWILALTFGPFQVNAYEGDNGADGAVLRKQRAEVIRSLNMAPHPSSGTSQQKPIIHLPQSIHRTSSSTSQPAAPSQPIESHPSRVAPPHGNVPKPSLRHQTSTKRVVTQSTYRSKIKKPKHHIKSRKASSAVSKQSPRCGFCTHDGLVFCGGQSVTLASLIEQDRKQRKHKHSRHHKKRNAHKIIHKKSAY